MLLVVDNGSVYTKNLTEFLSKNNIEFQSLKFDKIVSSHIEKSSSFILSGRRENNKQMNSLNSKIIKHAIEKTKPLLGICYGVEILALTLGGTIRKMNSLQKGNQEILITDENPICIGKMNAFESHRYELAQLPNSLILLGNSKNCQFEIVRYKKSNIFGTQFHPEMTDDGQNLIEKFTTL